MVHAKNACLFSNKAMGNDWTNVAWVVRENGEPLHVKHLIDPYHTCMGGTWMP